jgi:MFS family permease
VPETPEFVRMENERSEGPPPSSLRLVLRRDRRGLVTMMLVALGSNAISYIVKTFSIAYVADYQGVDTGSSAPALSVAAVVAIAAVPIVGWRCDRYSGGPVLAVGGVLAGVFSFPFLALLEDASEIALMAALLIGHRVHHSDWAPGARSEG